MDVKERVWSKMDAPICIQAKLDNVNYLQPSWEETLFIVNFLNISHALTTP